MKTRFLLEMPNPPVGFCDHCLALVKADMFTGERVAVTEGVAIVGGYCEHHEVGAFRIEYQTGDVGPWRLLTPICKDDYKATLHASAASANLKFRASGDTH